MMTEVSPIKAAVHGMDGRSIKTMALFFQGPCKGAAAIVDDPAEADVEIFDADVSVSKALLEDLLRKTVLKPVIVLSLYDFEYDGVLHLKKPVKMGDMMLVLNQTKTLAEALSKKSLAVEEMPQAEVLDDGFGEFFNDELFDYIASTKWEDDPVPESSPQILRTVTAPVKIEVKAEEVSDEPENESAIDAEISELDETEPLGEESSEIAEEPQDEVLQQELKTFIIKQELGKTSKHQTALRLNEKEFHEHVGIIGDIDLNDPKQLINANYDPNDYFQGYLQSALNLSRAKGRPFLMQTQWCPVFIFGHTEEVWLDASDSELNAFAGIKLKHKTMTSKIKITPIDTKTMKLGGALDKFQSMDAFLWKLVCWTSKGRYPQDIDYNMPVYLKYWPNFSRLLITPHALRIAALLIQGPRTMSNIAETLNIKAQYVFVFISAAYALGIAGQARRLADLLVEPADIQPSKGQGVLSRIMSKLHHTKT